VIESILKETGKDALRYVPAKVVPAAVNFAGLVVFTHILSPEDYGNYFIVLATISVMTIIGSNWVANSVIRFYPEFKQKGDLDGFFTNVVIAFPNPSGANLHVGPGDIRLSLLGGLCRASIFLAGLS
jgi:O-antigen/teichoic acid export membrane protein